MFYIEKLISMFIFSPMIYICILIYVGTMIMGRKVKLGIIVFLSGVFLYLGSITPVTNMLGRGLENKKYEFKDITPEVYVVLGGGSIENNFDIEPSRSGLKRVVKAAEVYNKNPKDIYILGGKVFESTKSESEIYKKVLVNLNIPSDKIIIEENSKNTFENAKELKKILPKDVTSIGLITSAGHMRRSYYTFKKELENVNIIPIKCDFLVENRDSFIYRYFPRYSNLENTNSFLWEYVGLLYYQLKVTVNNIL